MHESFLMMSSSHHHGNPNSEDDDQDNSLLALQERELLLRRCPDSTKNLVVMATVNGNTELPSSLPVLQESFGQAVAIASPAPVVELAIKNDTNNNSSLKNNGSNKSCGSKVMMISPLSFSDEECSSAVNSDGEEDDDELLEADQHPNPQSEKTCENHTLSAAMMRMRRGEEDDGKLKGWKTRRTIDNEEQHDQDGEMITGGKKPLKAIAAKKKNPFDDMPPVLPPRQVVEEHAEDEGFMSPYPHEGYSPSGSHSSGGSSITSSSLEEKIQRLSVSSGKGSSAEDLQEEDEEENLELFFLDSTTNLQQQQQEMCSPCKGDINHLNMNLNNYFNEIEEGREDDGEEDYVTLSGTSNSSATTNTTAVCGSFFPNSNSFQIENCHGRQVSSDDSYSVYYAPSISISSSCGLYATVAGDDEQDEHEHHEQEERGKGLRCENSHLQGGTIINYYDIPEEREREHIYDEVAVGQEDEGEQSVIIQSAHLQQSHGGNLGGIAFSTPINKERVNMAVRRKRSFMNLIRDSSYLTSSVNGSLKVQMRKSTKKMTPKPRRVITKKYTTPVVKNTPYSGKGM